MTQCARIIVGFMANVGNVFYPTFTNVFLFSPRFFFTFFNVFYFHLNVYYIYDMFHIFCMLYVCLSKTINCGEYRLHAMMRFCNNTHYVITVGNIM